MYLVQEVENEEVSFGIGFDRQISTLRDKGRAFQLKEDEKW